MKTRFYRLTLSLQTVGSRCEPIRDLSDLFLRIHREIRGIKQDVQATTDIAVPVADLREFFPSDSSPECLTVEFLAENGTYFATVDIADDVLQSIKSGDTAPIYRALAETASSAPAR